MLDFVSSMAKRPLKAWIGLAAAAAAVVAYAAAWQGSTPAPRDRRVSPRKWEAPAHGPSRNSCGPPGRLLPAPSNEPVRLTCAQARAVIAQARNNLAQEPPRVEPDALAASTIDWLDPHGLWSASPDAPAGTLIRAKASRLLDSLETTEGDCAVANEIGVQLATWVEQLRTVFERSQRESHDAFAADRRTAWQAASEPAFENGPVQRPALDLARELGQRTALLERAFGIEHDSVSTPLLARMFPSLEPQTWGDAVLAAAVRAYVLQIDAHGAWAPFDEETSLYEVELEASGRRHLWARMSRTAVGVRVEDAPEPPMQPGDVVLAIGGVPTAGLSVEQVEQLGIIDPADPSPTRSVVVLRAGDTRPSTVTVAVRTPAPSAAANDDAATIHVDRIGYRDKTVAVLAIYDVPDDLGDEVAAALAGVRLEQEPEGVILDLRGNGGGSIDGAKATVGLFLPGAPLFPMRRRDGSIELEVAPMPPQTDRWSGPVATLVDAETASAAEMIAGALSSYGRGVVIGARTYGKGCAQEYLDDDAAIGVLRLSTLVYALPDGRPVQRVGLPPDIGIGHDSAVEREDALPHAMAPWRGPDVRRTSMIASVPWPSHAGRFGPCRDATTCRALRALGMPRTAKVRPSKP